MSANPFEVLRLDPSSSEAAIVRQAGRLRQRITDEADLNAIRQAVQALTGRAEDRLLHALLTHPSPCHHWPALDRFAAAHRRAPAPTGTSTSCPPLDIDELRGLLCQLSAEELEPIALPFEPVASGDGADEVLRLSAEAIWQSLLFDPRA